MSRDYVKDLEIYYNLANKSLGIITNKEHLFKKSFIYASENNSFHLMNSMYTLLKESRYHNNKYITYIREILLNYYTKCPDYSNIFIKLLYELLSETKELLDFRLCSQLLLSKLRETLIREVYMLISV
jgi:hypothetical protein